MSLDAPEEDVRFYYKHEKSDKCYSISRKAIDLVPFFKTITENDPADCISPENALIIQTISLSDNSDKASYEINTIEIIDFLNDYIAIWEKKPEEAGYVKKKPVDTGMPSQIIKPDDLSLIVRYIKAHITHKEFDSPIENKKQVIKILNPLVRTIDGYLRMTDLANKLYAYCACLIFNSSLMDLAKAYQDPYFKRLQKEAEEKWKASRDKSNVVANNNTFIVGNGADVALTDEEMSLMDEVD